MTRVELNDELGNELYEDDIVEFNGNKYLIKYEIGAYMLINIEDVNMYEEFKDCWNDDVYPLAQLYWNTDSEENCINGLVKIKEGE